MALDTIVDGSKLTALANAIRGKTGGGASLTLDDMATEVAGMSVGFDTSVMKAFNYAFKGWNGSTDGAIDLTGLDTSSATAMSYMFYSVTNVTTLDVSGLDVSGVTDFSGMFNGAKFSSITGMGSWNATCSASDGCYNMFSNASNLTTLDLSGFTFVTGGNQTNMIYYCSALQAIRYGAGAFFNAAVGRYGCSSLDYIVIDSQIPPSMQNVSDPFSGISSHSNFGIYVPDGYVATYEADSNWSQYAGSIFEISDYAGPAFT